MVELKGHQQQEAEGLLQFHLCLIVMESTFTSLKVCNLRLVFRGLIVLGVSEFRIETPDTYTVNGNSLGFGPQTWCFKFCRWAKEWHGFVWEAS